MSDVDKEIKELENRLSDLADCWRELLCENERQGEQIEELKEENEDLAQIIDDQNKEIDELRKENKLLLKSVSYSQTLKNMMEYLGEE